MYVLEAKQQFYEDMQYALQVGHLTYYKDIWYELHTR